jgi:hypothetical protein
MSQVNIILTDKEDGTLGVQIIADQDEGKAHAVAVMFMDMLQKMNEAKIITES